MMSGRMIEVHSGGGQLEFIQKKKTGRQKLSVVQALTGIDNNCKLLGLINSQGSIDIAVNSN